MKGFPRGRVQLLGLLFSMLCGACGSSDDDSSGQAQLQFVNGILDSPTLIIELEQDDDLVSSIAALGFSGASGLDSLNRGSYDLRVLYIDPETEFEEVLLESELVLREDLLYQAVLSGSFALPDLTVYERRTDLLADEDEIELRLFNLSSDSVSAYLGDDSAGLSTDAFIATAAAGVASDPELRPYDEDASYRARVVLDGEQTLRHESAEVQVSDLSRVTLVVTDSTGLDPEVKSLFLVRDSGSEQQSNERASSAVRVLNAVVDGGTQQIIVRDPATGEALLDSSLLQGEASAFRSIRGSFVTVEVSETPGAPFSASATVSLDEDRAFTISTGGSFLEDDVSVLASETLVRPAATLLTLHFVNGLRETDDEDVDAVDVYALRIGEALSDTAPLASNLAYLDGVSRFLPATGYDLVITTAGSQSILAGPRRVLATDNARLLVVGVEAAGGGEPYGIEIVANAD